MTAPLRGDPLAVSTGQEHALREATHVSSCAKIALVPAVYLSWYARVQSFLCVSSNIRNRCGKSARLALVPPREFYGQFNLL